MKEEQSRGEKRRKQRNEDENEEKLNTMGFKIEVR